jgi:uncharacterized protein (TIGR02246 family)
MPRIAAGGDVLDDERAIREVIATWLRASMAGDQAKVLELMTDDVVFLRPGMPPMRGKADFAAAQSAQGNMRIEARADIQEISVIGEFAYCWNKLVVEITPDGQGQQTKTHAGDVLSIFRKQAGVWRLFRDANLLTG